MKYIQPLIILALILYIIFLQQCTPTTVCPEVVGRDTVTVTDTIPFYIKEPITMYVPVPEPYPVEVYIHDTVYMVNMYNQAFEDSLLTGELMAVVDGNLLDWEFTYTPKFPKYIKETTTITNTVEYKSNMLFVGLDVTYYDANLINTNFKLSLYQKKGYLYSIGYDPLNKGYSLGMQLRLNK